MNLIIKNESFKPPGLFEKIPLIDPGIAKVYRGKNDFYMVATEKVPVTKGELMINGIHEYFDVTLREFSSNNIVEKIRDRDKYYKFNVEINIKARVCDPIAVIRNNINNPFEIISEKLNFLLKRAASKYTVEERERFADDLYKKNSYFKRVMNEELHEYGLKVREIFIEVLLNDERIEKIIKEELKKINEFKAHNDREGLQIWVSQNKELMDNLNIAIENSYRQNKRVREDYMGYLEIFRDMDINIDTSLKSLIDIGINNNVETIEFNDDDTYKLNIDYKESNIEQLEDD